MEDERSVLFAGAEESERKKKTKQSRIRRRLLFLFLSLARSRAPLRALFLFPPQKLKRALCSRARDRQKPSCTTHGNMQKRSRFSRRMGSVLSSSQRSREPAAPHEATIAVEGASVCPPEPMVAEIVWKRGEEENARAKLRV